MAVEIAVRYDGHTRTTAIHGPSQYAIQTVAPTDNGGDGSTFSPSDLVATGLGTCIVTIMAMAAAKHGHDLTGITARVEKHMSADPPRRIVALPTTVTIPSAVAATVPTDRRPALESAGRHCPVAATLEPAIDAPIAFVWE